MRSTTTGISLLGLVAAVVSCAAAAEPVRLPFSTTDTPVCGYTVRNSFPHDSDAFTQGLSFADGFFFEGTGLLGRSSIRRVDPAPARYCRSTS